MSYRSVKRVLGETSLERKCRFLFGACMLLLITGSFWWYGKQTEALVYQQNPEKGKLVVEAVTDKLHIIELYRQNRTGSLDDDREFTLEFLSKDLSNENIEHRFIGLVPGASRRLPEDSAEEAIVRAFFAADGSGDVEEPVGRFSADGQWYRHYQPIRAQQNCLTVCHSAPTREPRGLGHDVRVPTLGAIGFDYHRPAEAGDLIAVARVDIPTAATMADVTQNRAMLILTAIITVFLAMTAAYVIVRYVIVKPLKHLRDVSDAVTRGDIQQRAEIHTADDFEELAVAFNRMIRHLIAAGDELRQVNADLDSKVDQLAQANMRLFEMNRLKSDFLATMSHELRTPLNSIIGFSDVLGSISSLDDKQKRYVQNIQKSGKMLLDMINDILDLAKIESGKMELRLSDYPIGHVVAAQCDMARPLAERKNIDLTVEIAPNLPELHQDQSKVQQILSNLLSNAIKFTPDGGRISVQARRDMNGDLLLVVADTGVGIAEEDQTAVFEKFRQGQVVVPGEDAMTREFAGTGLGLSIVKELCKLLGGEVSLESELGKGSTFTVRLPWTLELRRSENSIAEALDGLTAPRRGDVAALSAPSGA